MLEGEYVELRILEGGQAGISPEWPPRSVVELHGLLWRSTGPSQRNGAVFFVGRRHGETTGSFSVAPDLFRSASLRTLEGNHLFWLSIETAPVTILLEPDLNGP